MEPPQGERWCQRRIAIELLRWYGGHPMRCGQPHPVTLMPIRASERGRYPADWADISLAVKEEAGWRCECEGECGSKHHTMWKRLFLIGLEPSSRCPNLHGQPSYWTGATVVLTTAHLNHTPEDCERSNLRVMCQMCHLNYDRAHHAETRAAGRAQ
jgi:hypothetical protein